MPLTPFFLDTSFVLAILNKRDQWHEKALALQSEIKDTARPLVTTEFILTEIADSLSTVRFRELAGSAIRSLLNDELIEVIPATTSLFNSSLALFESRSDKTWGLTDCSSFTVMRDRGLTISLTTDDDFRQAGFAALMLK